MIAFAVRNHEHLTHSPHPRAHLAQWCPPLKRWVEIPQLPPGAKKLGKRKDEYNNWCVEYMANTRIRRWNK